MKLLHAFCDPKDTMPVVSHMAGHYVYHNGAPYYDINAGKGCNILGYSNHCLLYTSPSPRDQRGSRMPSSA